MATTGRAVEVDPLSMASEAEAKGYDAMRRPAYPTPAQVKMLREAANPSVAETRKMRAGMLAVDVPAQGLLVPMHQCGNSQ